MIKERIITGITLKRQRHLADKILKEVVIPQTTYFMKINAITSKKQVVTKNPGNKSAKSEWYKRTNRKISSY